MGFLDIVVDLRLQIYSELLVLSEPIDFKASYGIPSPALTRVKRDGLHPAILRVCRLVFEEATPLLYSKNRFEFPRVCGETRSTPDHAHIAPFLNKIGTQARFIRHLRIPFPSFDYPVPTTAKIHEVHVHDLVLIRKKTNTKIVELLISHEYSNYALDDWPVSSDALNLLDRHLKAAELPEVIIIFEEYPDCEPSDDLIKEMQTIGWTVTVKRLPKRVWISCDDRVQFDNEEDCRVYDEQQLRWEEKLEEEREQQSWLKEYYRRRNDPYWKNDSDYD